MRKVAAILIVFLVIIATPILFWQQGAYEYFVNIDPLLQYVILGIFFFPVAVLVVGSFMIAVHQKEYVYAADFLSDDYSEKDQNPYTHIAVGMLVAFTQDFSRGSIAAPETYSRQFRSVFEDILQDYQRYREEGYGIHYEFYHNETHNTHTMHTFSEAEVVVEIDGVFNYYMEENGRMYAMPDVDEGELYIRQAGRVRLRVRQDQITGRWELVGFWDGLTDLSIGLATR